MTKLYAENDDDFEKQNKPKCTSSSAAKDAVAIVVLCSSIALCAIFGLVYAAMKYDFIDVFIYAIVTFVLFGIISIIVWAIVHLIMRCWISYKSRRDDGYDLIVEEEEA